MLVCNFVRLSLDVPPTLSNLFIARLDYPISWGKVLQVSLHLEDERLSKVSDLDRKELFTHTFYGYLPEQIGFFYRNSSPFHFKEGWLRYEYMIGYHFAGPKPLSFQPSWPSSLYLRIFLWASTRANGLFLSLPFQELVDYSGQFRGISHPLRAMHPNLVTIFWSLLRIGQTEAWWSPIIFLCSIHWVCSPTLFTDLIHLFQIHDFKTVHSFGLVSLKELQSRTPMYKKAMHSGSLPWKNCSFEYLNVEIGDSFGFIFWEHCSLKYSIVEIGDSFGFVSLRKMQFRILHCRNKQFIRDYFPERTAILNTLI